MPIPCSDARLDVAAVVEHWTLSRRSVVLSGRHDCLQAVADQLGVAHDQIVEITPTRAALALWGAPLAVYQQRLRDRSRSNGVHQSG